MASSNKRNIDMVLEMTIADFVAKANKSEQEFSENFKKMRDAVQKTENEITQMRSKFERLDDVQTVIASLKTRINKLTVETEKYNQKLKSNGKLTQAQENRNRAIQNGIVRLRSEMAKLGGEETRIKKQLTRNSEALKAYDVRVGRAKEAVKKLREVEKSRLAPAKKTIAQVDRLADSFRALGVRMASSENDSVKIKRAWKELTEANRQAAIYNAKLGKEQKRLKNLTRQLTEEEKKLLTAEKRQTLGIRQLTAAYGTFLVRGQLAASLLGRLASAFNRGYFAIMAGVGTVSSAFHSLNSMVQTTVDRLDKIEKVAQSAGISMRFLQEMEYAAQRSGMSVDNLQKNMQRLTYRVGLAARGATPFRKDLLAMGYTVDDLNRGIDIEGDLVYRLAKYMNEAASETDRMRTARNAFGMSGSMMANMFRGGADNLRELIKQSHEYAQVVDTEIVAQNAIFADQLGIIDQRITVLKDTLGTRLAPILIESKEGVAGFTEALINSTYAVEALGIATGNALQSAYKGLADTFGLTAEESDLATASLEKFYSVYSVNPAEGFGNALSEGLKYLKNYVVEYKKAKDAETDFAMSNEEHLARFELLGQNRLDVLQARLEHWSKEKDALEGVTEKTIEQSNHYEEARSRVQHYSEIVELLTKRQMENKLAASEVDFSLTKLMDRFVKLRGEGRTTEEALSAVFKKIDATKGEKAVNSFLDLMAELQTEAKVSKEEIEGALQIRLKSLDTSGLEVFIQSLKQAVEASEKGSDQQARAMLALKAATGEAFTRLGLKVHEVLGGVSEAGEEAISVFNTLVSTAQLSGNQALIALDAALKKIETPDGLRQLKITIQALGSTGQLSADQVEVALSRIDQAAARTAQNTSTLAGAFKALGAESQLALQAAANESARNWDSIEQSLEGVGNSAGELGTRTSSAVVAIKNATGQIVEFRQVSDELASSQEGLASILSDSEREAGAYAERVDSLSSAQSDTVELTDEAKDAFIAYAEAVIKTGDSVARAKLLEKAETYGLLDAVNQLVKGYIDELSVVKEIDDNLKEKLSDVEYENSLTSQKLALKQKEIQLAIAEAEAAGRTSEAAYLKAQAQQLENEQSAIAIRLIDEQIAAIQAAIQAKQIELGARGYSQVQIQKETEALYRKIEALKIEREEERLAGEEIERKSAAVKRNYAVIIRYYDHSRDHLNRSAKGVAQAIGNLINNSLGRLGQYSKDAEEAARSVMKSTKNWVRNTQAVSGLHASDFIDAKDGLSEYKSELESAKSKVAETQSLVEALERNAWHWSAAMKPLWRGLADIAKFERNLAQAAEKQAFFNLKAAEAEQSMEGLTESFEDGDLGLSSYIGSLDELIRKYAYLDEEDLSNLRKAMVDAKAEMDDFTESARQGLVDLKIEWNEEIGNDALAKRLQHEEDIAAIEEQIAQARKDGNQKALRYLRQQKQLTTDLYNESLANLNEQVDANEEIAGVQQEQIDLEKDKENAVDDVTNAYKSQAESAASGLLSLKKQWAELNGEKVKALSLEYENDKADTMAKLEAAQKANNEQAVKDLQAQLAYLEKIYQKNVDIEKGTDQAKTTETVATPELPAQSQESATSAFKEQFKQPETRQEIKLTFGVKDREVSGTFEQADAYSLIEALEKDALVAERI